MAIQAIAVAADPPAGHHVHPRPLDHARVDDVCIVALPSRIVEPLIALSIAYVAVENLVTSELRPWPLALVFSFGLLHGGFVGVRPTACLCVVWYRQRSWYHQRVGFLRRSPSPRLVSIGR